jgi:transglutaminase-like putative cysteine protease
MGGDRAAPATPSLLRRLIAGPRQGWLSVLLVGVMIAVVGLALDDTGWLAGPAGQSVTWWLPAAMLVAGLIGFLFGVSRVSTAGAHMVAALSGAAVILVGSAVSISSAPTLLGQLHALSESFSIFVNEVFVLEQRSSQTSAPLIVLAAIGWTTGYFSAFNVFRRNRGMAAVVSGGLVLLVNMSITSLPQYGYLIVFALAAMLLLVRLNIVEQSVGWQRRHIGNTDSVSALFLRGGSIFVTIALLGAIFLAATASSAPLAGAWQNLNEPLLNLSSSFNQLMGGFSAASRGTGGAFDTKVTISGIWSQSTEPAFSARTSDGTAQYWRGVTYEAFDGKTWFASGGGSQDVPAEADLVTNTAERGLDGGPDRTTVKATITWLGLDDPKVFAPDTVVTVDQPTQVLTAGDQGPIEEIKLSNGQPYTVTSRVPNVSGDSDAMTASERLTAADLAAAGTEYPTWVTVHYLGPEPNGVDPLVQQTAEDVIGKLGPGQLDPYHEAHAIQDYFARSNQFHYNTDVTSVCGNKSPIQCVLVDHQGYCQHFATAMTLMLRSLHIPARYVQGYLPGTKSPDDKNTYIVTQGAAHAWVEVFFPDYGWIRFDPTPGTTDGRQATELPAGTAVNASPSPEASIGEGGATTSPSPEPTDSPAAAATTSSGPIDPGALGMYAVTAAIVVAVCLVLLSRRRRRPGVGGDQTFERVARLAARLGYAPRPSQTAYEYAGSLAEIVPALKPELQVVATAKVEATYGRRAPTKASLASIHAAYARIRRSLVLLFLHPRRPKPPRG